MYQRLKVNSAAMMETPAAVKSAIRGLNLIKAGFWVRSEANCLTKDQSMRSKLEQVEIIQCQALFNLDFFVLEQIV